MLFSGIPGDLYFRTHRLLRPYYRLRRRISPIPRSPEPASEADLYKLRLVPPERLIRRYCQILCLLQRQSQTSLGNYVEFGVYNGTSLNCMFQALRELEIEGPELIGFDSFQGLPPGSDIEDGGVWRVGQFTCPRAVAQANIIAAGVPLDRFELIEGWYTDTLVRNPHPLAPKSVSVVMIDSDTRSSAALALEYIEPRLNDLAVIFFDDWKLNNLDIRNMGEYRAFKDFLQSRPKIRAWALPGYNRKSIAFLIRRQKA